MGKEQPFEIVEHVGIIAQVSPGWALELNRVSWFGGAPKLDVRCWREDHGRCGKGITLTDEEALVLAELIQGEERGE